MPRSGKLSLTARILIAMGTGVALGVVLNLFFADNVSVQRYLVDGALQTVGTMFIAALKMLVVPLVFVSLVAGVTALGDAKTLGRIGIKAVGFYLLTTALAISIALTLATIIAPGAGLELDTAAEFTGQPAPPLSQILIDIVPDNPVAAMADGNMLQIIVFALLFGLSITLAGDSGRHVSLFFNDLNFVVLKMVDIVIRLAPIGVFCLITITFATQGIAVFLPLAKYALTLVAVLLIHGLFSYGLLLHFIGRLNPLVFLSKVRAMLVFAFSTASSNATIPVTLKTVEEKLGVKNSVASFTVPLGATVNMDGTAIMQGVATVFIANVYSVDLGLTELLMVILTATLASIGTAGIPSVGLVMLALVLEQAGLPVEGIALIIGIDRLLDMLRTAVNVTGDAAVTAIIAKSENALDEEVYYSTTSKNKTDDKK
jgi:DAACS family dicarboxylate/amino acid:cation (Na+ or H+) symporter